MQYTILANYIQKTILFTNHYLALTALKNGYQCEALTNYREKIQLESNTICTFTNKPEETMK